MSQFDIPAGQMPAQPGEHLQEPRRTDGLAIGALICSLIVCCPITTLLGPLLGVISAVRIAGNAARKGMGIAVTAIVLGLAFTGVQGIVAYGVWTAFQQLPAIALEAAATGETTAFRQLVAPPASSATDEEIEAFGAELVRRYGNPVSSTFKTMGPKDGDPNAPAVTWEVEFERATLEVEIEFPVGATPGGGAISRLRIIDPEGGDLVFPPATSAPTAPTVPADAGEADEAESDASESGGDGG